MKSILYTLFVAIATLIAFASYGQTDNERLAHVKNVLSASKNCDEAFQSLDKISPGGKMSADYFLCMGKANDCRANNAQALYYYNKYLELQPALMPTNDSIKRRVAELTDQKANDDRLAAELEVVRQINDNGRKKKKSRKRNSLYDKYGALGVSYDMGLGGSKAPFKSGATFTYSGNSLILHRKVILGFAFGLGSRFAPNNTWFSKVFDIPASAVKNVNGAFYAHIMFTPSFVIYNSRKLAIAAGPGIGPGYFNIPEADDVGYTMSKLNTGHKVAMIYTLRADLFLGTACNFFVEYAAPSIRTVSSTRNSNDEYLTPVNHSVLRFGVAAKFDDWTSRGMW